MTTDNPTQVDAWLPIEAAPKSDTHWLVVGKIADSGPNTGAVLWWYRAMFWRGAWRTSRDYSGTIQPTHFFDPERVTAPSPSSPVPAPDLHAIICPVIAQHCEGVQLPKGIVGLENDLIAALQSSSPVPAEQKHHKHCSSWTVNTSGERQPCDCVCECRHTMFEHIRPGEHYWYEDCAVEGCPCMKFATIAK